MPQQIPIVSYLDLGERPHLVAQACDACGALYFDRRNACAHCFAVDFSTSDLAATGTVRAFTFVHRVKVPFVSVIVDLADGGVVKANLLGVDSPAQVTAGMSVQLETFVLETDDDGTEAVAFGFRPTGAVA